MEIRRRVFLPNIVTILNGVCGFAALVNVLKVQVVTDPLTNIKSFDHPELFGWAAWLILIGMVFDVFDGKLARLSGRTSDLGAQLDSFCDLTTFGLAPATLVVRLNMIYPEAWGKAVWFLALAYFLGALLRLARFNVENVHDATHHMCFKGLPSPAAAGCVASLVIFHRYIQNFSNHELQWLSFLVSKETVQAAFAWIPSSLAVLLLILGYTMVSGTLKYDHVASRIFSRRQSFEFLVALIFGVLLAAWIPEVVLPVLFIGYLASTPTGMLLRQLRRSPGAAAAPPGPASASAPDRPVPDAKPGRGP